MKLTKILLTSSKIRNLNIWKKLQVENCNMDRTIRSNIILDNKRFHGFKGKFKSYFLTLSTKLKLYEALPIPVLI
jgi:hypothetical protein